MTDFLSTHLCKLCVHMILMMASESHVHGTVCPQVVDGGDRLHMWWVAADMWKKQVLKLMRGGP
jgi:hypothetical protein